MWENEPAVFNKLISFPSMTLSDAKIKMYWGSCWNAIHTSVINMVMILVYSYLDTIFF